MSEPAPEAGPVARFEKWAEEHIAPDIADIKAALAGLENSGDKTLTWIEARAANARQLAALVVEVAKAIEPADASVVAGIIEKAEAIAAEADRIAEEILGDGK